MSSSSRLQVFSWVLYDFSNTIFSMNVVTMYFPLWLTVGLGMEDIWVGFGNSFSMLLVALSMPLLGVISDVRRKKMPFLIFLTLGCVLFTALIGLGGRFVDSLSVKIAAVIIFYTLANYSYQGGLVFYNALLPAVSTEKNIGRISGYGVALGYVGAIIGMILVMPFNEGKIFNFNVPFIHGGGRAATFVPTAVLFLLFSLPTFVFLKDKAQSGEAKREKIELKAAFLKVVDSLSNTKKYPGVLAFLIAKFLYEDAINTIIIFMAVYASKVMNFPDSVIIPLFIVSTTSAIIGSALFGLLTDKIGSKITLMLVLLGWIKTLLIIVLTKSTLTFWIMGSFVGIFMGGTWTAARPLLITLAPKEMLGEFFGLYSLSGRCAAITGPLLWGAVVFLLRSHGDAVRYKGAVFALMLMVVVAFFILWRKVPSRKFTAKNGEKNENI
jgi:UMF1 family MFS transporter